MRNVAPPSKASRGPSVLRDINLRTVLRLLRAHNPCSCSDLARYSGLSVPTVASSVSRLEHMGLAKRLGKGSSSGGRPPDLLRFNEAYGYVAGIEISDTEIRLSIANLTGEVIGESEGEIGEKSWPMAVVERMVALLTSLRESLRIPAKRLLAVGVAAPGITDVDAGVVVSVPTMQGWENVPLGRLLAERLHAQVIVENDVNIAALGEHSYGMAQGEPNFAFVHIGRGVGAGLIINGQIHHGPEWTAGEIGYLPVPGSSVQAVRKSQLGALECAIGSVGIERQWREQISNNGAAPSSSTCALRILDLALEGDAVAQRILDSVSECVATVCSYLSLILNCSLIVFGGELGMHPALIQAVNVRLEDHDFARPRLAITQLGAKAENRGALRVALQAADASLPPAVGRH
ncbi:MAG: ROK family transcriptional regulator [Bryobacteraceae bacterium]